MIFFFGYKLPFFFLLIKVLDISNMLRFHEMSLYVRDNPLQYEESGIRNLNSSLIKKNNIICNDKLNDMYNCVLIKVN